MAPVPKHKIWRSCDDKACERLHGLRDTTIYVTYYAYWHASVNFVKLCQLRNINMEVVVNWR